MENVSDDKLLRGLFEILKQTRHDEADLVAHIAEVDARKLYAREAAPSMFAWCTEVLHLSEAEAYLRIAAARASRRHPMLLVMLADGRLHVSGIERLAPHLTEENRDALLERAVEAVRGEARWGAVHVQGQAWPAVQQAPRPGVPPPEAVRPRRPSQPGRGFIDVQGSQRTAGRPGLRKAEDGAPPAPLKSCPRADSRWRVGAARRRDRGRSRLAPNRTAGWMGEDLRGFCRDMEDCIRGEEQTLARRAARQAA